MATKPAAEGKVEQLGVLTTTGYEATLDRPPVRARRLRQLDFWVKPDRIVPLHLVKGVGGGSTTPVPRRCPSTRTAPASAARWVRDQGINTLGVCLLHAYANPDHEERLRQILREEAPRGGRLGLLGGRAETAKYERAMTTLVDAAVKPKLSRYVTNIKTWSTPSPATRPSGACRWSPWWAPFYAYGVRTAACSLLRRSCTEPITTCAPGRGRRRRRRADRRGRRPRPGADLRRRRHLDDVSVVIDGEPTTRAASARSPSKIPMIDVVTVGVRRRLGRWLSRRVRQRSGPPAGANLVLLLCYAKGGADVTITDAHVVLCWILPHRR